MYWITEGPTEGLLFLKKIISFNRKSHLSLKSRASRVFLVLGPGCLIADERDGFQTRLVSELDL